MLIDEVDVLFSDKFFGKTFNLAAPIKNKNVRNLVKLLYDNYNDDSEIVKKNNNIITV